MSAISRTNRTAPLPGRPRPSTPKQLHRAPRTAPLPGRPRPLIAFTSGDPAGIGPQAVLRALSSPRLWRLCRPLLVGEASVWRRAGWNPGRLPLFDTGLGSTPPSYGKDSPSGGRASYEALRRAAALTARGIVSGIVTAPVSKTSWRLAGVPHADHTDFLARTTASPAEMILGIPARGIWCVIVTRHCPLSEVPGRLSAHAVAAAARALDRALRPILRGTPRLGLCGLNPHAGERDLLGDDESRVLLPAMALARRSGVDLSAPLPADAAWHAHLKGRFDGLVSLYHDQALIPLKAVGGMGVVNWTAGIPFVRTSPGHGTAFDIAGRVPPDPAGTFAAAELACRLARRSNL